MQNTVQMLRNVNDRMTFDMKGSTINRKVPVGSKFWKSCRNCKQVLKDINYLEINRDLDERLMSISMY